MINVVTRHMPPPTTIERIVFVLFDETAYDVFREELNGKCGLQAVLQETGEHQ